MANRIYERHVRALEFSAVVKRPIPWGQSPQWAQADLGGDIDDWVVAGLCGFLQPGDRIRLLHGQLPDDVIRVEVRPHDGRKVGNSQQRVWIRWPSDGRRVRGLFRIEEEE